MNTSTCQVMFSQVDKVSVTITRKQLWINYVNNWRDLTTQDPSFCDLEGLGQVASVFIDTNKLDPNKVSALFKSGNTVFLMDDAMRFLDTGREMLREIIVVDFDGSQIIIRHQDITF